MFRFTIRDVLWLMVVVGIAVGWWIDRIGTNSLRVEVQAENLEVVNALMKQNAELQMKVDALKNAAGK
jgi:uncharacterized membrane-anchored protein YhcB (DUF1043 family)